MMTLNPEVQQGPAALCVPEYTGDYPEELMSFFPRQGNCPSRPFRNRHHIEAAGNDSRLGKQDRC